MSNASDLHALATGARHLQAGKYFQVAAFVVLIYDHAVTFSDEVERVWQRKLTGASILFFINRYVTPLQFIVIIDAFQDPRWTTSACKRYVAFEGASTVALIAVCELIMILRMYALYARNTYVLFSLMILWVAQIIISSIGLSTGFAAQLPPGFVGCIFTGNSVLFPSLWVAPLVTDSCIFLLTVWRTWDYVKESRTTPTIRIFFRDGLMYFLVIFMANLMNTLIYFMAVQDLKAIGASFSQLITATMISRLVLNLRTPPSSFVSGEYPTPAGPMKFMERTIGNLGEELETILDHHSNPSSAATGTDEVSLVNIRSQDTISRV